MLGSKNIRIRGNRIRESDVESTCIGADEVAVGEVVIPHGKAVVGGLTVVGMCATAGLGEQDVSEEGIHHSKEAS
ncbi:uncharacterized protein MONOS_5086 [Monocercomonoides exilis]|uniref:uncharacterized protein n=1 Tax=Monocercomonoides exilis TaxID=2049356 RepID=UPI003559CD45|nr:hypothetical protein MONOS_5086 [Monocercomonoides exilis]|eukprot:MONOS_5086.1-p1 / transcript=MONOS_5086.1 / gene=MONOS_5086 / organism=Monocercomonoides_exilis_PA203 / gene_product=unspecified product / transcript_product=unspecified product / location=Mono_scaffold00144:52777-53051(+) / protein_length=75 / sequence_SO=supercontig / SO=protein_coding / is_pseudo=false